MVFQILVLLFLGLESKQLVQGAAPTWVAKVGTATVAEDAAADTAVTITATPALTDTPTSVEILSTSTTGSAEAFSVALTSGATGIEFKVKAAGVLDRETSSTMIVNIRATNDDGSTDGNDLVLTITISDANDNAPEFLIKSGCVEKANTVTEGTSLGTYGATDLDDTANGLDSTAPYAIVGTSTKFDLDTASGEIKVKTGETLTSGGSWTLMITAKDQGATPLHTSTTSLTFCVGTGCCSGTVFIRGTFLGLVLTVLSYYL